MRPGKEGKRRFVEDESIRGNGNADHVAGEVGVCEFDAFGFACGARGVDDGAQITRSYKLIRYYHYRA